MDVNIPKQIFSDTEVIVITCATILGALVFIYAQGQFQVRRFKRCFAKHFPEIPAEQCALIIKQNGKLIRDMSFRASRGLMTSMEPVDYERALTAPLKLPKPSGLLGLKALRYVAETPQRIMEMVMPETKAKETPIGSAVRAVANGIRASLADLPMLSLDHVELMLRFRGVWCEWLQVRELPDEVSRAIRAGLKAH